MDRTLEDTFYLRFTTHQFTTGAPFTLAGSPVVSAYENGSVTQITAGITLGVDHDSVTGLNLLTIVATAANGFESGKSYDLVITTGTVDGVSAVGEVVGSFTLDQIAKAVWDRVLTGAIHNIPTSAGRRLRGIQDFQGYENGAIWIDTVNGTAGTTNFENGTVENPVLTLADALTLNASLGFNRFTIFNGSTITLASTFNNYLFIGENWTLALGGQDTGGTHFHGATVSGICTGTETTFIDCHTGNCTIDLMHLENCSIGGTLTAGAAGDHHLSHCHSAIAGTSAPVFDVGAANLNTNVNLRGYSGGMEFQNLGQAGIDTVSVEGDGQVILNANCIGGSISIRGNFELTDNSATTTVNDDARYDAPRHVDLTWDEPLTGGTHNVTNSSGKRIRDLQEFGSYEGGAISIDTVNGAAGTTDYESGTILNPVDTIADANTLAASLGLSRFEIAPSSSLTFAVSQTGQVFSGIGWTIALGGQDISNSEIIGAQVVTGNATAPTGEVHFTDCEFISGTLGQSHLKFCGLGGTLTLSAAANYTLSDCYSQIPGSPTPVIDFGAAVGNTGLSMRRYSGGIEVQNYGTTGTDTMSIEGNGQLIINANCAGGTIYIRGNFKVTDNSGGAVAVVYDDNTDNIAIAAALFTTQITESYAADGVAPTPAQALMVIQQMLGEFSISGTTLTVYGVDGVTAKATFTLDDSVNPTSLTRSS